MPIVEDEVVAELPTPVQRCLRRSGVVGQPVPNRVTIRQAGEILLRERWFPFTATQHYTVAPPGFEWRATVRAAGLPVARGEDSLSEGRGRMHVRLFGLFTVVDETGPEMDQGSVMRWFNETMWFPHVWATEAITWAAVDDTSAIGSLSVAGQRVEAEFRFDGEGRLIDFLAERYRVEGDESHLAPWATPINEHARFGGVELASAGSAVWEPATTNQEYIRIRLRDIRYD